MDILEFLAFVPYVSQEGGTRATPPRESATCHAYGVATCCLLVGRSNFSTKSNVDHLPSLQDANPHKFSGNTDKTSSLDINLYFFVYEYVFRNA